MSGANKSLLFSESTTYRPFRYPALVEMTKIHEQMAWGEWEGKLQDDLQQWDSGIVVPFEKNHITQILRLFTTSDQVVGGNYVTKFLPLFKNNEARMALLSIANRESTHMRAYALLNDTLNLPESEYSAFMEYQAMADKVEFMRKENNDLALDLAQTIINEGVSLFSAFAMLLNYSRGDRNDNPAKMKGMGEIVLWSIRDESMHCAMITNLFRTLLVEEPHRVTDEFKTAIYDMARTAVTLEDKVIDLSFEMGEIDGLSSSDVKQYVRYLANRRLMGMGLKANWPEALENPVPWFDKLISNGGKANFFETVNVDYSTEGLIGEDWGYQDLRPWGGLLAA
jgi:ribonucleoside-diphosphate reductase beta chain